MNEVTQRGLEHTAQDRPLVATSIARVNRLLAGRAIRLAPAWEPLPQPSNGIASYPVYLIRTPDGKGTTPAAVPKGCQCVFVDPAFLESWAEFNSQGNGRLTIDRKYFLDFVLLHEAGHIANGTAAGRFENGGWSPFNIDPSKDKTAEIGADDFAATILKDASQHTSANNDSIQANWVVNELVKASWNMQAYRTLDEFGAFAIGKRSVFFDNGYTHPNMAWRILRVNHAIQQSEATSSLLKAFEEARERGEKSEPLYKAPEAGSDSDF